MPVETEAPVEAPIHYSHEKIRDILEPYANRGWLKRFDDVKNRGQKFWLYVVRDFNIQNPEVEYIIDDIVRALEVKKQHKSAVRDEMNKLESEGKLKLDTQEEEAYWEKRLQEERDVQEQWKQDDHKARMEQRELDIAFIRDKRKKEEVTAPIAEKAQDPKNMPKPEKAPEDSPELDDIPKKRTDEEQTDKPKKETKGEETKEAGVSEDTKEHPTEPTELEKKQQEFVPKPPPENEPPDTGVVVKSVEANGEEVYNKDKSKEKPKLDTIKGLPKDAIKRLNDIGVNTIESFSKMDKTQAKQILGAPVYANVINYFKS